MAIGDTSKSGDWCDIRCQPIKGQTGIIRLLETGNSGSDWQYD